MNEPAANDDKLQSVDQLDRVHYTECIGQYKEKKESLDVEVLKWSKQAVCKTCCNHLARWKLRNHSRLCDLTVVGYR